MTGEKLTSSEQVEPLANVLVPEPGVNSGQVEALPRVKPVEMLGFVPVAGAAKVSGAFPSFSSVTVWGLSLLVVPSAVLAKL
jgi:hypothetical protein